MSHPPFFPPRNIKILVSYLPRVALAQWGFLLVPLRGFLVSCLLFLVSCSPIQAASSKNCGEIPDAPFDGPQYYYPKDASDSQCSLPTPERQIQELELSSVDCIDNPDMTAKALNFDAKYLTQAIAPRIMTGSTTIEPEKFFGFGVNNDTLSQVLPELTNYFRNITIPDYFDPTLHDALCVYEGITNRSDCTAYLKTAGITGKENLLASTGWLQRATTLKSQFKQKQERANQVIKCVEGTADPLDPCDQIYLANKVTGESSYDLAKQLAALSYEEFINLPSETKMTLLSLRETRALSGVYLVIIKTDSTGSSFIVNLVSLVGGGNPPSITQTNYVPGIYKSTQGAETLYRLVNKQDVGNDGVSRIRDDLYTPLDPTKPFNDLILDKINAAKAKGLSCDDRPMSYQNTGSQANRLSADSSSFNINVSLQDNASWAKVQSTKEPIKNSYEAYMIAPTAIMDQMMATDKQAVLPQMFKASYSKVRDKSYVSVPLTTENPRVSTGNVQVGVEIIDVPCGVNPPRLCPSPSPVVGEIAYEGDTNIYGALPGGGIGNVQRYGKNNASKLDSSNHYSLTCLDKNIESKANTNVLSDTGTTFSALYNLNLNDNIHCTPEYTSSTTHPAFISGDVCEIAREHQVDCNILLAVWQIESGGAAACAPNCLSDPSQCQITCPDSYLNLFSACNQTDASPSGPLSINRDAAGANRTLNRCIVPEALALAADILVKYKNGGNPVTVADLQPTGKYQGCNYCQASDQTQYRWGAGVSYCDAVSTFISTGSLPPPVGDTNFDPYGIECYPD